MSDENHYTAGTKIWVQDKETWRGAVVTEDSAGTLIRYKYDDDGTPRELKIVQGSPSPPLRNPDILIGLNDLTALSYLHEPGVLYNLKYRFTEMKTIYTYCGIVLVAINPYQKLGIYGVETMWTYRGHAIGELEPHVFAVAEEAFKEMERASLNQSIIVSGESGAGKTVSAKYAMRYFATVGGSESVTSIERKVLASQPIMEAIGNAKTTRNDNSSRFGKYVELQFNTAYSITGASMRTYLLEKSRVVFQAPGERNYHIFYQILSSSDDEVSDLSLSGTKFNYTKTMSIKGVNDGSQFSETLQSMKLLGFGIDDRRNYFKLLAGILHLGNIEFVKKGDSCSIQMPSAPLTILSNLLSVSAADLAQWLTHRRIRTAHEEFLKPMTGPEAEFSRDALAKLLYDSSFNWIVERVNETLKSHEEEATPWKFIGVLDIYGFETFDSNSFEQFCINYANEKLQQQFNQHMFKLDQEEYAKEAIEWTFIHFYDNQPCIDLIEAKMGILSLLDEETRMPAASDKSWTMKLYKECGGKYEHFRVPKRADGEGFTISHFASEVLYTSSGFLEKNRDTVLADQIETIKASKNSFISSMIVFDTGTASARKKTVSVQFRSSLISLMSSLNSTTPHYIRCVKPNDDKLPFVFQDGRALQQLRACGVLETVRIQASGFPTRWTYSDFANRYRVLCTSKQIARKEPKKTSVGILERAISDGSTYKLGLTKIFFRSGVLAYLEKIRSAKLSTCITLIQKIARGWVARRKYVKIQRSARLVQRYGRGLLARRKFLEMRQRAAAIVIQKYGRMMIERRKYRALRELVIRFQSHSRRKLAMAKGRELKREKSAIVMQKWTRMYLQKKKYKKVIKGIILLQCCTRRFLAKKQFKQLKLEARSLEKVKALNKGLENKIIELQLKVEGEAKLVQKINTLSSELTTLKTTLINYKQLESNLKQATATVASSASKISELESALKAESEEKVDIVYKKSLVEKEAQALATELETQKSEIIKLQEENKKLLKERVNYNNLVIEKESVEKERDQQRMTYASQNSNNVPIPSPRLKSSADSALVLSLQSENNVLKKKLEETSLFNMKLHDMEIENDRLQKAYNKLIDTKNPDSELRKQLKELEEKLSDKSEETRMLKSCLTTGSKERDVIVTLEEQLAEEKRIVKKLEAELSSLRGSNGGMYTDEESDYITANYELNDTHKFSLPNSQNSTPPPAPLPRRYTGALLSHLGVLEYEAGSEHNILKTLIFDLKTSNALKLHPKTLPAYIIFMLVKHTDNLNNDERVRSLLSSTIKIIKKLVTKRNALEYNILWLSITLRLLHILKQYSGEVGFVQDNTAKQNEQCLRNFDLSEYRQAFSDMILWLYVIVIKGTEDKIQPNIVPALLESGSEITARLIDKSKPLETLIRELNGFHEMLSTYEMDTELISQLFKQLFYYITSASMNNLLLRKDLCNWSRGLQIRYNVSTLEEWCRTKHLETVGSTMQPLIQASQLLQANKLDKEKDIQALVEMSDKLTVGQVVKILHLYTPEESEMRLTSGFIKKVQEALLVRTGGKDVSQQLLMDTKHVFPVKLPYHPSSYHLDELEIPEFLGINEFVKRL